MKWIMYVDCDRNMSDITLNKHTAYSKGWGDGSTIKQLTYKYEDLNSRLYVKARSSND